jgi:hypothetical protein
VAFWLNFNYEFRVHASDHIDILRKMMPIRALPLQEDFKCVAYFS